MAAEVAGTIIKIAIFIVKWKAEYQDSQNDLKSLGPTVELVKHVVSALDTEKHTTLESPLRALMDCLNECKDILVANAKKKGKILQFLFPKNVSEQITILETRIHKLVSLLSLAVSTTHLNQSTNSLASASHTSALDFIVNEETKKFWKNSFGATVFSVKFNELEKALMQSYSEFLDSSALCDLRLRLDNLKTGHVSCHRLSDFCGSESLSRRLQQYTQKKPSATIAPPPSPSIGEEKVFYPLLLWVDDRPENNNVEIQYAKDRGVCIIVLNSTSEAKQWITRHPDTVEHEDGCIVRMITDNAREGADTALDINAGEDMIRFVRGRRSTIPIMVYCGNLDYTKYTANYTECTAANKRQVCLDFINQLKKA